MSGQAATKFVLCAVASFFIGYSTRSLVGLELSAARCEIRTLRNNLKLEQPATTNTTSVKDLSSTAQVSGSAVAANKSQEACQDNDAPAELKFVSYTSSPFEQQFLAKMPEMAFPEEPAEEYCKFVVSYAEKIGVWLTKVQESKDTQSMYFDDDEAKEIFSVYEFRYPCSEADGHCTYKTMIEPLAFGLRHPAALCTNTFPLREFNAKSILDTDYIFFATSNQTRFGPQEHTHVDLGAAIRSKYMEPYVIPKTYERNGISFNRMLLWEAMQINGNEIFRKVPKEWYSAFQYFDIPATSDVSSVTHPLNILKEVHPGSGFIGFKLDIDHNTIESDIAMAIIKNHTDFPAINAGQFEFFFEHHVDFPQMRSNWGVTATRSGMVLGDSYALFLTMRKLGIRAHSWV